MKIKRFLSFFLLFVCLFGTVAVPGALALEDPLTDAVEAAILVDRNTDTVIYAKNDRQKMYPASLTKVMTALLTLKAVDEGRLSLTDSVIVPEAAFDPEYYAKDGSTANIKPNEILTVEQLLQCMLIVSANEAANVLAITLNENIPEFVQVMNDEAKALGCECTHFVNANGLHDPDHYTCAWDLYLITKAALRYPAFMEICDTASTVIPATNVSAERHLYTTNNLLSNWRVIGYRNKEAHGIKTGSTTEAGHCLISSASRGSLDLVSVVLGAQRTEENGVGNLHSFSDTTNLFNYAFDHFSYRTILETKETLAELPVLLSKTDYVTVHPAKDIEVIFPDDLMPEDLERIVTTEPSVNAPITAGQVLGSVELRHGDTVYGTVNLLATNDVESDPLMVFWYHTKNFFSNRTVQLCLLILILLIAAFIVWRTVGRRNRRYGRGYGRSKGGYSSGYRGRRR